MSDFEDFEDLFDKEAEIIQKTNKLAEPPSEDENQQEDIIEEEDEEIDYSKYTDNLELEEYLKRKINHLCINLSTANLKNEYDINANTLKNLKQLKKGLTFDTKVLESRLIYRELYNNNILEHDLIHIINMYQSEKTSEYLMNCIFGVLEIIYTLTNKIQINEESSKNEIENYNHVKKIQLIYKKQLVNKNTFSKLTKILTDMAFKFDFNKFKNIGTNRDKAMKFVIIIIKNILEIDLFDMIISDGQYKKMKTNASRNNKVSCLPAGLNKEDIGIKHVLNVFEASGMLTALLKLTQTVSSNKNDTQSPLLRDPATATPLLEIWYSLLKDISPVPGTLSDKPKMTTSTSNLLNRSNSSIQNLLLRDEALKKRIVNNTSSRHSKFGTLITVKTDQNKRTQLTNINNRTLSDNSLDFLDDNKKELPKYGVNHKDKSEHWLKSKYLNMLEDDNEAMNLHYHDNPKFADIIEKFILSKTYNNFSLKMLKSVTDSRSASDPDMVNPNLTIKFFVVSAWFMEIYRNKISNTEEKYSEKYQKLLIQYLTGDPRKFFGVICSLHHRFTTEKEHLNFCVVHSFNKFFTLVLELIITKPLDIVITYLSTVENICDYGYNFQDICTFPRLLDNSTNLILKQSSISLLNAIFKLKHEIGNLKVDQEAVLKDPFYRHTLDKEMEQRGIQKYPTMFNEIENFLEDNGSHLTDFYKNVFHMDLITTLISYIESAQKLSYRSQKTLLRLLTICLKCSPVELQRIDFIINMRQWQSSMSRRDRLYPHIDNFSTKFLSQVVKRLKYIPNSGAIELLFADKSRRIHDVYQDSNFLETGVVSDEYIKSHFCIKPSTFNDKFVESISGLIRSESVKQQLGVVIGSLQEKNKEESVKMVLAHLNYVKENVDLEYDILKYLKSIEHEKLADFLEKCTMDPDFRLFLQLLSYTVPHIKTKENCVLSLNDNQFTFNFFINLIENFLENPMELNWEEDISMTSLLVRPSSYVDNKKKKKKQPAKKRAKKQKEFAGSEEKSDDDHYDDRDGDDNDRRAETYEDEDGFIDDGEEEDDDSYFKQLSEKRKARKVVAKSKKLSVAIFDGDNGLDESDDQDDDMNVAEDVSPPQPVVAAVNENVGNEDEDEVLPARIPTEKFVVDKIVEETKVQSKISYDTAKSQLLKRSQMFRQQKKRILEDSEEDEDESEEDEEPVEKKQKTDTI